VRKEGERWRKRQGREKKGREGEGRGRGSGREKGKVKGLHPLKFGTLSSPLSLNIAPSAV
jgi:hypothetical protein